MRSSHIQAEGAPLECGNFRGIKLLVHGMKVFEKFLERRLRNLVIVNNVQFYFIQGNIQQRQYLS